MSDEQEIPQSIPDAEPLPAAPAPSEAPAPAPSEAPLHWTKESAETDYAKHFVKDEDISNYREFRKDIDDYSDGVNSATTAAATFSTE